MSTYRAYQVTGRRQFELVERELLEPQPGHVRFRAHSRGICHTDAVAAESVRPDPHQPLVPGHEIVGVIDALGEQVSGWSVGDRVGVGFLGGHFGVCVWCRRGDFVNCENQPRPAGSLHRDLVLMGLHNSLATPGGVSTRGTPVPPPLRGPSTAGHCRAGSAIETPKPIGLNGISRLYLPSLLGGLRGRTRPGQCIRSTTFLSSCPQLALKWESFYAGSPVEPFPKGCPSRALFPTDLLA